MSEIVVGLDLSPSARAALDWGAEQARATGQTLRAVQVINASLGSACSVIRTPSRCECLSPLAHHGVRINAPQGRKVPIGEAERVVIDPADGHMAQPDSGRTPLVHLWLALT